ncbi:hypothetical protein QBC33DRAFT_569837 [Phialemonium atrogriseum]|uniref:Antifungal protein n=1 Tax=Phialemonium atrogriseum TaxID=1093897 RepID=A0AAJ0FLL9_9PEZI|nr:uncharacterized protein QBC33DRAFT_569837 [Phialemonium atrogriseum]KAK1767503.1 hypothetical protein QBC33DRAFT_569837 [Phialemonium atrogriseum]
MQPLSLLVAMLLPLGALAAPVAEDVDGINAPILYPRETLALDQGKELFDRGPGTNYKATYKLPKGANYLFTCVKSAECVVINGATNCGWDWLPAGNCWVNGHYTDSHCTAAKLGMCAF